MRYHLNPYQNFKGQHAVALYDSPVEAAREVSKMQGRRSIEREMEWQPGFYSGQTWQDMVTGCLEGDAKFAARSKALMSQIAGVTYETPKRMIKESPYGRPCVGAYLASDPMPCRRPVTEKTNHAPLSIVAGLNSQGSVPSSVMEARGVTIAALVRKVAAYRPVNLYLSRFCEVAGSANTNILIKFPTAPLDSFRLSYLLASQGFARGLCFAFHTSAHQVFEQLGVSTRSVVGRHDIGPAGRHDYSQKRNCPFSRDLRAFLKSDVLYIPGAYPGVQDYEAMCANPVQWLNNTMAELTKPATGKVA